MTGFRGMPGEKHGHHSRFKGPGEPGLQRMVGGATGTDGLHNGIDNSRNRAHNGERVGLRPQPSGLDGRMKGVSMEYEHTPHGIAAVIAKAEADDAIGADFIDGLWQELHDLVGEDEGHRLFQQALNA